MERKQRNGGEQQRHPERPAVNSYGTDDPETQAYIENARVDAARERAQDRARLDRLVNLGMVPDEAESLIEFDHYVRDNLRPREPTAGDAAPAEVETTPSLSPRIHVIDAVSHERGILRGRWIDANQEPDILTADINALLDSSPTPEATAWGIHATEGFAGLDLQGYTDTTLISKLARGVAEHGGAYSAWVALVGTDDRDLLDSFDDFHVGTYDSPEAWAREVTNDMEWPQQLENALDPMLHRYVTIDYARFVRDARQSWDVIEGIDGKTHVFMR